MSFEQLSPTEQAFAKEHHGLLICFIRTYQLDDDAYGMMSERYLKTVHRYLTNRRLRKYSFSTILWMSLRSELSHMLDQNARTPVFVPIEDYRMPTSEDDAACMEMWQILENRLKQKELELLTMRIMGNSYLEIGQSWNISIKAVNGRLYRIRKKIRGIQNEIAAP